MDIEKYIRHTVHTQRENEIKRTTYTKGNEERRVLHTQLPSGKQITNKKEVQEMEDTRNVLRG